MRPRHSGPPACGQRLASAKYSPSRLNRPISRPRTVTMSGRPGVTSLALATTCRVICRVLAGSLVMSWLRPPQIAAARRPDHVAIVVAERAAQERALHPAGELLALERRIALLRFRLLRAHHEAFVRIDQRDVGVETRRDVALVAQAKTLRRVPAEQLGHVVV